MSIITKLFKPVCKVVSKAFKPAAKVSKPAAKKIPVPVGKNVKKAVTSEKPKGFFERFDEYYNSKAYKERRDILNTGEPTSSWLYMW